MPQMRISQTLIAVLAISASTVGQSLAGTVVQDDSGKPVVSADVHVYRLGVRGLAADLETDRDGRFEATELATGDYRIEIMKAGYLGALLPSSVSSGLNARLTVRLIRLGSISGQVTNPEGQPVKGAT